MNPSPNRKTKRLLTLLVGLTILATIAGTGLMHLPPGPAKQAALIAWGITTAVLFIGAFIIALSSRR